MRGMAARVGEPRLIRARPIVAAALVALSLLASCAATHSAADDPQAAARKPRLKLAAERGSQIAELQRELGEAKAELAAARAAYARLMDYRGKNTLNFQLEKLDDYLRVLGSALQEERHS